MPGARGGGAAAAVGGADGADGAGWHAERHGSRSRHPSSVEGPVPDMTTRWTVAMAAWENPIPEPTSSGARIVVFEDRAEEVGEVVAKLIWERWRIESGF